MSRDRVDKIKADVLRAEVRALARGMATEVAGQSRPQQIRRLARKLAVAKQMLATAEKKNIVTSPLPTREGTGIESE